MCVLTDAAPRGCVVASAASVEMRRSFGEASDWFYSEEAPQQKLIQEFDGTEEVLETRSVWCFTFSAVMTNPQLREGDR